MLRTATVADTDDIRRLMKSVAGFWDDEWRSDVLARALAAAGELAIVSQTAEVIDGFVCAHDLAFRAYLSELIVAPSAQGRRVGTELLCEVERRLGKRGCAVVIADVWKDAEQFYRSRGWSPPSVVLMRKRLGS